MRTFAYHFKIMAVDLSLIVRHHFYDLENREKVEQFCKEAIAELHRNFPKLSDVYFYADEDMDIEPEYSIVISKPRCDIILRRGYWEVETYYAYWQYFEQEGNEEWLRQICYEYVHALGEKEAWACSEFMMWNSATFQIESSTFEDWMSFAQKNGITEMGSDKLEFKNMIAQNYAEIYHDDFSTLKHVDVSEYFSPINEESKMSEGT